MGSGGSLVEIEIVIEIVIEIEIGCLSVTPLSATREPLDHDFDFDLDFEWREP